MGLRRPIQLKRPARRQRLFALGVSLATVAETKPEGEEEPKVERYRWIHVASEESAEGHPDGAFALTREVFAQFVNNFRADPRYKAGDDGIGSQPVIPYDFEHASEMPATDGSIPQAGAPAPAWALELQVRDASDGSGKAELWAYTDLGETIRQYIEKDEYRHVSIAFALDAADPTTGESVGARISSIAFTNHPFLRALTPMQHAASEGGLGSRLLYYFDQAGSPEQGMEFTRRCLGLGATADVTEIKAEVAKVAAYAAAPATTPPGVDLDDIFGGLRQIWSLPVSSNVAEIVGEINKAAAQLEAAKTAAPVAAPAPTPVAAPVAAPAPPPVAAPAPAPEPTPVAASDKSNEERMSLELRQKIIAKLGRKLSAAEAQSDDKIVELVAEEIRLAEANTADLNALLDAMGKKKASEAIAALPELMAAKAQLTDALRQLEEAMSMQVEVEQEMEGADLAAAASAGGLAGTNGVVPEPVLASLKYHRLHVIDAAVKKLTDGKKDAAGNPGRPSPRELFTARREGRDTFLTEHKVAPEGRARLLKNLVAGPGGAQLKPEPSTVRTLSAGGNPDDRSVTLTTGAAETVNLGGLEGANQTQRLMTWVKLNVKGGDKMGHDQLWNQARMLRAKAFKGEVEIVDEQAA